MPASSPSACWATRSTRSSCRSRDTCCGGTSTPTGAIRHETAAAPASDAPRLRNDDCLDVVGLVDRALAFIDLELLLEIGRIDCRGPFVERDPGQQVRLQRRELQDRL